jgi:PhnB protein
VAGWLGIAAVSATVHGGDSVGALDSIVDVDPRSLHSSYGQTFKEHTMQFQPYLYFNGDCEVAFRFYEKCLGGKIEAMLTHAGTPAEQQVPAEWRDKILHARMVVGDVVLMASDAPPGRYQKPQGFSVSIQINNSTQAEEVFRALAESGTVIMPYQQTFFAARFGMVVDKFGTPWMVNCDWAP